MSVAQLSAFISKTAEDDELMAKIKEAHLQSDTTAYIVELGAANGFEFTIDDLLEENPDFQNEGISEELDSEELSTVAGGFGGISGRKFKIAPKKTMIAKMARVMNAKVQGRKLLDSGLSQICWPGTGW